MPVFHAKAVATTTPSSTTAAALGRVGKSLQSLHERALAGEDFEQFEREVHAIFQAAEREVLAEELAQLDVDLPFVEIGGVRHHWVLRSTET